MSKYLVAFYNGTDDTVKFVNKEHSGDNKTVPAGGMFTTDVHFNVPDNSNSEKYFDAHHMEIQTSDGTSIFSFWDDDSNDYILKYCKGKNWEGSTNVMGGYNPKGNEKDIGIVVTGSNSSNYQIKSCPVQYKV